jgi:hypothetical protein
VGGEADGHVLPAGSFCGEQVAAAFYVAGLAPNETELIFDRGPNGRGKRHRDWRHSFAELDLVVGVAERLDVATVFAGVRLTVENELRTAIEREMLDRGASPTRSCSIRKSSALSFTRVHSA